MIDYEKLKLAHELSLKYSKDKNESSTITTHVYAHNVKTFYRWNSYSNEEYATENIDDLIAKLKELTKLEPKYKIGDVVWYHIDVDIFSIEITDLYFDKEIDCWMCIGNGDEMNEEHCYPTKQALIDSQIEYWRNLRDLP